MARIIHLALEASSVLKRYMAVHDALFGASFRHWASVVRRRGPVEHAALERQLSELESKLAEIRAELAELPDDELTNRSRNDIRTALELYTSALSGAIGKLRVICQRMGEAESSEAGAAAYPFEQRNADKVAYDDAIQAYKRSGDRLNRLLSTF